MRHLQAHDKSPNNGYKLHYQGSMPADSALINGLFLSILFLVFNTFRRHQIEKKTCFLRLRKAILWLQHPHFYLFALHFDANRMAICVKTRSNQTQIPTSFDTNRSFFQHNFTSRFSLKFIMFWLPKHCNLIKCWAYFERSQIVFWICQSFNCICKVAW